MKRIAMLLISAAILFCIPTSNLTKQKPPQEYTKATIAAGPYHAMVIKENGILITWGDNYFSTLGTDEAYGQFPTENSKVMEDVCWVSGGRNGSYAVDNNGVLWSWGYSVIGRDGIGDYPMPVMEDVVMVSTSGFHTLVLKTDGSVWGWGDYTFGQLGRNMGNTPVITPQEIFYDPLYEEFPVKIMDDAKYVSAAAASYVIKNDNTLWSFGWNKSGQLGDGTTEHRTTPVQIMENVMYVDGSGRLAIQFDSSLWEWGQQNENSLSQGSLVPVKIMEEVKFAACGDGGQRLVVKNDGSLWTWGENHFGILGDGTEEDRWEPQKVIDSGVVYATGSTFLTLALKEDGSLWHMGCYSDHSPEEFKLPHKFMDGVMLPY